MLIVHKSRKTPVAVFAAAALTVAVAAVWFATGSPGGATPDPTAGVQLAPPSAGQPATTARVLPPGNGAAPATPAPVEDPAQVFELGFSGGLVIDAGTVSALDRLHSMLGENPGPEDIARLENQLRQGLPREEADKAIKLLHGYRGYSQDMRTDVMNMGVPQTREAADALLARMTSVQSRHFDPAAAEAMFAEQNRLSKAVLDAALVQMDTGLSDPEKKTRLDAIRAGLPEAQRQAIPEPASEAASAPQ